MLKLLIVTPLLLGLELPVTAQVPGGYPGGGSDPFPSQYPTTPGIPVPRRSKDKGSGSQVVQIQSLSGVLKQMDSSELTIVAPDTRIITAKRSEKTKFLRQGEPVSAASFAPGDRVRVEATQDDHGVYHAATVHLDSKAVSEQSAKAEPSPAAPAARVSPDDCSDDEADPGPPHLRRGGPSSRKPSAPARPCVEPDIASEEKSVASSKAPDWRTVPTPSATAESEDPMIEKARQAVSLHTASLPNYFCQQQVARFASSTNKGDWQPLDVISATVVFEDGRDEYRNVTLNGKRVSKRMEDLGGTWSTGEFGMMASDLFSRATAAEFTPVRASSIAGREAMVYDFDVDLEHSHWQIQAPSQSMRPAYKGRIWLDSKTADVLRVEMETRSVPKEFPLDKVESAVDYEYVRIGDNRFLLPVHAENLACVRGTPECTRNVIDFRNYRKYAGQSTITFDK